MSFFCIYCNNSHNQLFCLQKGKIRPSFLSMIGLFKKKIIINVMVFFYYLKTTMGILQLKKVERLIYLRRFKISRTNLKIGTALYNKQFQCRKLGSQILLFFQKYKMFLTRNQTWTFFFSFNDNKDILRKYAIYFFFYDVKCDVITRNGKSGHHPYPFPNSAKLGALYFRK